MLAKITEIGLWYFDRSPRWLKWLVRRGCRVAFNLIYFAGRLQVNAKIPLNVSWISPGDINNISLRTDNADIFSKYFSHGVVCAGDWDKDLRPIEDDLMYKYAKSVFINNADPAETDLYQAILSGGRDKFIKDEAHLKERLDDWKNLYARISTQGLLPQSKISGGFILDEICVSIGRGGTLILEDGRHRFMIARAIGLKKIPFIVNRVHQQYWETCGGIIDATNTKGHTDS
jgi:hypothetical protein